MFGMSVKISLEMPAPLSTSSCHVIDPDDSRMTVCGATLQTHERDAKECTACYSKLTEVAESFNVLMLDAAESYLQLHAALEAIYRSATDGNLTGTEARIDAQVRAKAALGRVWNR